MFTSTQPRERVSQYDLVEKLFIREGGEQAIRKLANLRTQSQSYLTAYYNKLDIVNANNKRNIETWDNIIAGTKFIRDTSATLVVIGTSVVTMPAAAFATLLTTGAAVKSFGKYTDTGNVGAAGVEFVCEMGVGLLGGKAISDTLNTAQKVCVVLFAKMPAEAAKSAVGGETFGQAAFSVITMGLFSGLSEYASQIIEKRAVPVILKEMSKNQSINLIRGYIENTLEDFVKGKGKEKIAGSGNNNKLNFEGIKAGHIKTVNNSPEQYVKKYCITPV